MDFGKYVILNQGWPTCGPNRNFCGPNSNRESAISLYFGCISSAFCYNAARILTESIKVQRSNFFTTVLPRKQLSEYYPNFQFKMFQVRIFNLKCSKSQALNDFLQANSNGTHWAHPLFRTSFPNFVGLVSPGVGVVRHLRCFPKWYIRKCMAFFEKSAHSGNF